MGSKYQAGKYRSQSDSSNDVDDDPYECFGTCVKKNEESATKASQCPASEEDPFVFCGAGDEEADENEGGNDTRCFGEDGKGRLNRSKFFDGLVVDREIR